MNRRSFLKKSTGTLIASTALLGTAGVCYGFAEAGDVRVVRRSVRIPKLPRAFEGTTLAFLTDLHHGPYVNEAFVASVVRTTMALQPDLIVHGGDYILRDPKFIPPCFELLASLKAPLGVFGVLGNHDHYHEPELTQRAMKKAGIMELTNCGLWLQRGSGRLRLGGVDDLWRGEPTVEPALEGVKADDACILVCHNPDFAETLTDSRVGFMLSGHTHGGQVFVPGMQNPFIPSNYGDKYRAGLVEAPSTTVYVSRGLGQTGLPIRYNCPPELTLLTLTA
jgi:predicted MPP superfamily phosphohydrolase